MSLLYGGALNLTQHSSCGLTTPEHRASLSLCVCHFQWISNASVNVEVCKPLIIKEIHNY